MWQADDDDDDDDDNSCDGEKDSSDGENDNHKQLTQRNARQQYMTRSVHLPRHDLWITHMTRTLSS